MNRRDRRVIPALPVRDCRDRPRHGVTKCEQKCDVRVSSCVPVVARRYFLARHQIPSTTSSWDVATCRRCVVGRSSEFDVATLPIPAITYILGRDLGSRRVVTRLSRQHDHTTHAKLVAARDCHDASRLVLVSTTRDDRSWQAGDETWSACGDTRRRRKPRDHAGKLRESGHQSRGDEKW